MEALLQKSTRPTLIVLRSLLGNLLCIFRPATNFSKVVPERICLGQARVHGPVARESDTGAHIPCARARVCCAAALRQCLGSLTFSSVHTTVPCNEKMEVCRLLHRSSVRILMFVAQLMWLDMRTQ